MSKIPLSPQLASAIDSTLQAAANAQCDADVIINQRKQFSLKAENGALSEYKVTSSSALGVRLLKNGKVATSYTESLSPDSIQQMVDMALESMPYTEEALGETLVATDKITTPNSEIFLADNSTEAEKIDLALSLESAVREANGKSPYNGYTNDESNIIYANSLGALCHHQARTFSCYTSALVENNTDKAMSLKSMTGRQFSDLHPQTCAADAIEQANALLEGKPLTTSKYSVVFDTNCLAEVFSAFSLCFSGEAARKETNPWRNKVGQHTASTLLSLSDVDSIEQGLAIKAFDGEGLRAQTTPLIVDGELQSLLHNTRTAKHFGVESTGNGARGPKSRLSVGSRHTVISAGHQSVSELQSGRYLYIVDLQGVHSGADAISGDFSFGCAGFLYQDGDLMQPIKGITIAGNFYQMLKEIDAIGIDQHRADGGSFYSPDIRFSSLNVAGS
ncbi:TldD/PmbA family protein [Thaumasiovibrio sp. DFM-14]|uniref:TldD/PmbA family protein n=1 Tax=Thaumasiovibrio sp. DFM-14 TaxID=3384792 RepID=UPI0039A188D8